MTVPGAPLFGLHSSGGRFIIFGTVTPVRLEGHVIAAIGVSGGTVKRGQSCASASKDRAELLLCGTE